jgi:hypothetical protein
MKRAAVPLFVAPPRCLFTLALMACTACFGFGVERSVDAPDGSYTPARWRVTVDGRSEDIDGARVTPAFFAASGTQPLLGRLFTEPEYQSGLPAGILAHRYWTERFGSSPSIIGSTVEVDGRTVVVVGIAPSGFSRKAPGCFGYRRPQNPTRSKSSPNA